MAFSPKTCMYIIACLASRSDAIGATPVEKVISLLTDLSAKVEAEGKKEATAYDKYSCFCKEQADEKLYNIEKSNSKIASLNAKIEMLRTQIAQLEGEIRDDSLHISALEKEIKEKTEKRNNEHEEYQAKATDLQEAIDACDAALEALRSSKSQIADSGAKVNLMQVTNGLAKAIKKQPILAKAGGAVALLSKLGGEDAPGFEFQSNDIIATIANLMADFKRMKAELDHEEHDINAAFESDRLGLANEKKFTEQSQAEKNAQVAADTEALQGEMDGAIYERDEEVKDRDADQSFMDVLVHECEEKAHLFDQRSKTRAAELTALSDATATLKEGALDNYKTNKKLVGVQRKVTLTKVAPPVSFIQIHSLQAQKSESADLQQVRTFLNGAAERTGSQALSALAARVTVAADHFVKVRGIIKDLLVKLENDAKSEADQKSFCDKAMSEGIKKRDQAKASIEDATAKITTETANLESLKDSLAHTLETIAELKKALNEAITLRQEEKANNEKTMAESRAGADAVKYAISVLSEFYHTALVQTGKYVPPDSDRNGKTVGDLAPEVFGKEYHGAQSESKGILGILEVIESDFERTFDATKTEEEFSREAFETFESETNASLEEQAAKEKLERAGIADANDKLLSEEQNLADANTLASSSKEGLESVKAMCVDGEETWEERKAKREQEIEALKQALQILEDWQN